MQCSLFLWSLLLLAASQAAGEAACVQDECQGEAGDALLQHGAARSTVKAVIEADCTPWCHKQSESWDHLCSKSKCAACAECANPTQALTPEPSPEPADPTQALTPEPSPEPTEAADSEANCKAWCHKQSESWDHLCSKSKCAACAECADPTQALTPEPSLEPADPMQALTPEPSPEPADPKQALTPEPSPEPADPKQALTPEPSPEPADPKQALTPEPSPEPADPTQALTPEPSPEPTEVADIEFRLGSGEPIKGTVAPRASGSTMQLGAAPAG